MDFIFMLTRDDRTVPDCLEVLEAVAGLDLRHVGFKDVGVPATVLRRLVAGIRGAGAHAWMELVATDRDAAAAGARLAAEIGVDRVLGGCDPESCLAVLRDSGIAYYPFPGRPRGLPTLLDGTATEIAADARRFADMGCAGVDLLAYRAVEADPIDLLRAARAATRAAIVVAGDIDSTARIEAVAAAGADGFTVGSAAFAGSFAPGGDLAAQIAAIRAACAAAG